MSSLVRSPDSAPCRWRALSVTVILLLLLSACGAAQNSAPADLAPDATVAGRVEEAPDDELDDDVDTVPSNGDEAGSEAVVADDDEGVEGVEPQDGEGDLDDQGDQDDQGDEGLDPDDDTNDPGGVSVSLEPAKAVPNTVPVATSGCEGVGFGEASGEMTTRVGVLVPDYRPLIETGFVPRVTPIEYRARYLASTFGANMRNAEAFPGSPFELPCGELELVVETYDPLDPATQRDACIALADGPGVIAVLSELEDRRGEGLSCLTEEAGIPVLTAGSVTTDDLRAGAGRLLSIRPPVDLLGTRSASLFHELGLLDGQRVAVVGGDGLVSDAAAQAVIDELNDLAISPVVVTLPDSRGITDVWAEIPQVAENLAFEEVTVVISVFDAVVNNALWDRMIEQNVSWQFLLVDAMGSAEHDKVTRLPDEFGGLVATSLESEKEADRSDPASLECIADYAAVVSLLEGDPNASGLMGAAPAFELPSDIDVPEDPEAATTTTLDPVVEEVVTDPEAETDNASPSELGEGDVEDPADAEDADDGIETAVRELLGEDRPPGPACALVSTLVRAILAADSDLNATSLVEALHNLGPTELFIEGTGSLTDDKNYIADFVQVLQFTRYEEPISEELAAPCDSPDNCWRSIDNPLAGLTPLVAATPSGSADSQAAEDEEN